MRTPLAAWRAGVRWPLALIASLAAIVVAILICEALGWPFLVTPIQHRLESMLDRRVVLGGDGEHASGVRIGLLGSVRVRAASIEIGAPSWSPTPHTLLARDADLKLRYLDLWRAWHGAPLHIRDLEAASLDAMLERREDGRASWQFGKKKPADADQAKDVSLPTFGRLAVADGHLLYLDQVLPAGIDARFALSDGSAAARGAPAGVPSGASAATPRGATAASAATAASGAASSGIFIRAGGAARNAKVADSVSLAPGESGLRLKAVGQFRQLPVRIDLGTAGVLGFFGDGADAKAQPLSLRALIGRAELSFDGTTLDPLHFTGLKGRFKLAGPSLAAVGDALGITLPTTPPFATHGTLVKDGGLWKAVFEAASIGMSRLDGAFTYDKRRKVPLLAGRLGGSRLLLADLGPAVGAPAPGSAPAASAAAGGRVIPDKKFDLPSLRAMDANVVVDIGTFDSGTDVIEPLHPARAHLLLADGVLTIADFEGVTAQGKLVGYLQLDGRAQQALWNADMRLLGVNLAQFLRIKRKGDSPPYLSGKLDALVKVKGSGRSTAEILGSLDGDLRMHMRDASLSHLAIEAAGIDIAQALGIMIKGDESMRIKCNVADLDIVKGVAKPKVFVINTDVTTIWIDGTVSLHDESLDLRAVVSPKNFSPFTLRTPVHVKGTFGKPAVSLELGKLAGKAGAAGLLALLNPIAAIIPFMDPGAKKNAAEADAECAALARTSGVIPGVVRTPASAHIPPAAAAASASASASAPAASASAATTARR